MSKGPKKNSYEPLSEVQRAWLRSQEQARQKVKPSIVQSFAPVAPQSLYPIMQENTLRNTSSDWRERPEVLLKARALMVDTVRQKGVDDTAVLNAMRRLPRHVFVDDAFYLRAYDDDALPIGHGQTISQPSTVARMLMLLRAHADCHKVLEIGTGCGYQAAVLALCVEQVYSIERIAPLYELASFNLNQVRGVLPHMPNLRFSDGMLGWAEAAPFDGIILAAAGLTVPQTLLEQLRVGGVLIAPVALEAHSQQHLVRITRTSEKEWQREILETVRFVPLVKGVLHK
ncbi:protein-L-isoaspartate(D-aspartate) O-methyltransferase [Hydromonas duriensis]|uniref:Protein-L-isoaspartate O-methyltransferase n=1 Tax=Hydromonas duriensis TaxID=1527608 RepID=A0A4R6YBX1_9BURK|nr:protein-L-isoaspartate(D-aspartate) O-methyltransferase [Hydromonas duriensis]TDR33152.1 protein-L-isoaspartate(D-aspartate) O-methyltransferase [Hydromonas duriensis]